MTVSLSLGERVRVRGDRAMSVNRRRTIPGMVELRESVGVVVCFPE